MIDKTVLCFDHGLFVELAIRLSRDFKRVLYHSPFEIGFPTVNDCVIGDGFRSIERCDDIWDVMDDVDVFVFPDIQHSGLQLHLEKMGKNVWGSRKGDKLELQRAKFLKTLNELGLPVGKWRHVVGLSNLRDILKGEEDLFIKISRYRGSMETWHHKDYRTSEPILDQLAVKLGATKDIVPFVVCSPIKSDLEVGYDGYCIDGKFPKIGMQGFERKDKSLIGSMMPYDDLPKEVLVVNEAMAPLLKDFRYRNFWSTEIRIQDGESYFIDPTCRAPSPSSEIQLEMYGNLGEIIWAGSQGELVDPEPTAKFGAQVIIHHNTDSDQWRTIEIPDETRQWVKLYNCCKINGAYHIPPTPHLGESIGSVVGIGDSVQEAIDHLKENAKELESQPVEIDISSLSDVLDEIQKAEKEGMEFSDGKIPEPASVIEKS